MKGRFIAAVTVLAAAAGISVGALAPPASAADSTLTATVFDAGTNAAWSGTEVSGASAFDTAIVAGDGTQTPTGTVVYSFFADDGACATTPASPPQTVTLDGSGGVPNSGAVGPLAAGTYSYSAIYSGDLGSGGDNDPSDPTDCESFTVAQAASSTATAVLDNQNSQPWSGHEVVGAKAVATAAVTGIAGVTPTGNVTYSLFDNGTCTGGAATTQQVTLAGGAAPNSSPTAALGAGTYSFDATYGGDGNYTASPASPCASFSVGLLAATTSTTVFDATLNQAWTGTEVLGATAYDTATVTGVAGTTPTGSVTYSFFRNGACTGTPATTSPVTVNGDGSVPNSSTTAALGAGNHSFNAVYGGDANYSASPVSGCEQFTVVKGSSSASTNVFDATSNVAWSGSEVTGASAYDTATVAGTAGFTPSGTLTYSFFRNGTCTGGAVTPDPKSLAGDGSVPNSTATGSLQAGSYSFDAVYGGDTNYAQSPVSGCEPFSVGKGAPTTGSTVYEAGGSTPWANTELTGASAQDLATATGATGIAPTGTVTYTFFSGNLTCTGTGVSAGAPSLGTKSTATGPLSAGNYSYLASYSGDANYLPNAAACEPFTVAKNMAPSPPTITNIPSSGSVYGGSYTPTVATVTDGATSTTSSTTGICAVLGSGAVAFVGVGTCTLNAHTAGTSNYGASTGAAQSFTVGRATPTSPTISNIPTNATEFAGFVASVATTGDGATSVTSVSTAVCTVGADGHTVNFVGFGDCTLTASVAQGVHYFAATGNTLSFPVGPAARGYWLVGSDGGIFSFGAAGFYGSMGSTPLQRPVVGITPSASRTGYWLVASDGGIFSFGTSSYYGSIPAVGLHPAGSGLPNSLNAPIVAMVPSITGHGYFMVASDGGVFAFGDAHFAGSCPGIGGCVGHAVSVMPDSTGMGYWLVTDGGAVYAFGDATFYGAPTATTVPVVDAVATPDWHGYWLLYSNGVVDAFGDAVQMGAPLGYVNSFNPATAIFPTADGKGYWVAAARGDVFSYGDAPYLGSMAAAGLNGNIIAAFGF